MAMVVMAGKTVKVVDSMNIDARRVFGVVRRAIIAVATLIVLIVFYEIGAFDLESYRQWR